MVEKLIRETQVDLSRINQEIENTNTRIDGLGKVFNYKGRVDSIDNLPSSGNKEGDLYLVGLSTDPDKAEYFWTGSAWEYLGNTSNQNYATETTSGIIEIASTEEAEAGTDNTKAMTPFKVKELLEDFYNKENLISGQDIKIEPALSDEGIDAHTLLCCHYDTDFNSAVNEFTIANDSDFSIVSDFYKFGTSASYVKYSGRIVSYSSSVLNNVLKGDFTVDFWIRLEYYYSSNTIPVINLATSNSLSSAVVKLQIKPNASLGKYVLAVNDVYLSESVPLEIETWYHVAFVYTQSDKTVKAYLNGTYYGNTVLSDLPEETINNLLVSGLYSWVDELRLSDVVRYTDDFTPKDVPYTSASSNGKYAINFDRTYVDGKLNAKADLIDGTVPNSQLPEQVTNAVKRTGDTMTGALKVPTADLSVADTTAVNREWAEKKEQTRITNCITKIPQDIKLELSNGTLTLKAGSKVYVPNGAGVFDEVVTSSDISISIIGGASSAISCALFYYPDTNSISPYASSSLASGTSDPSGNSTFYNTTTNIISRYDGGSLTRTGFSFPIALITGSQSGITSIDQVFNGFGYIGNVAFILPGVECLRTYGRNSDGTLKSANSQISQFLIPYLIEDVNRNEVYISANNYATAVPKGSYQYDQTLNTFINVSDGTPRYLCFAFSFTRDDTGRILSLTPKNAFQAVDYNGADFVISSYSDANGNWYEVWKSGKIRQGGYWKFRDNNTVVTFLKPMSSGFNFSFTNSGYHLFQISDVSTTGFTIIDAAAGSNNKNCSWLVEGQGA